MVLFITIEPRIKIRNAKTGKKIRQDDKYQRLVSEIQVKGYGILRQTYFPVVLWAPDVIKL